MKIAIITNSSDLARYFVDKVSNQIHIEKVYIEEKNSSSKQINTKHYIYRILKKYFGKKDRLAVLEKSLEKRAKKKYFPDFHPSIKHLKIKSEVIDIHSEETFERLRELDYDLFILFGTSIVKKSFIEIPKKATINIHSSLLPYYKGTMVEFWQLYYRDYEYCGSTIHYVNTGIDTGNIIIQESINTSKEDTFFDLRYKNILKSIELLPQAVSLVEEGYTGKRQSKTDQPVYTFSMIKRDKKVELYRRLGYKF